MIGNANWIGIRKGEVNYWSENGCSTQELEELKGKVRVENRSLLFRKSFKIDKQIKKATLKICGLGFYYVFVNGSAADDAMILAPLYNDYAKRVFYDTYDVTGFLNQNDNVIAVEVGGGWFCPPEKWWSWRCAWYGTPRMISEIEIEYADGTSESIASDNSWKWTYGGVQSSCVYDGEVFDAREEPKSWKNLSFDDSQWTFAECVEAPKGKLQERVAPPVRITRKLSPVNVKKLDDRRYIYDFGENVAAVPCVTVKGKNGDSFILNHAEFSTEDGLLNMRSNNRADCVDTYYLCGENSETYRPRFTWHGFRYMMITLSSPEIEIIKVESHVLRSDVETIGSFSCSREDLNRVHDVIRRTALSCIIAVPVDCPQRDERLPWLGDVHASSETYFYNFNMEKLYDSFLEDIRISCESKVTAQIITPRPYVEDTSIDWNVTYPALLVEYYKRYGNIDILRHHYNEIKNHTNHYVNKADNGLIENCWFGDWFSVDQIEGVKRSTGFQTSVEGDNQNPPYNGSLFYYQTLLLSAEIASLLGEKEDAAFWSEQAEITRNSLIDTYFNKETGVFGRGGQFSQTFPLSLGVLRGEDREKAFSALLDAFKAHDGHSVMGVMGVRRIFDLFISEGHPEMAYELLTKEGYPGVLDHTSHNRTTLPEGLDGSGSGCHIMFGSPDSVLFRFLAGVKVDRSKENVISISPYIPDDLSFVNCEQILPEGKLTANWKKEKDKVSYYIEIPQGLTAVFKKNDNSEEFVLTSGVYKF